MLTTNALADTVTVGLDLESLPPDPVFEPGIRRAPKRDASLTTEQELVALENALRYIPERWHERLAPEFLAELRTRGRIYGYRFRPTGAIKGLPIDSYKGKCIEGRAFQVMIDNNLDFAVALYQIGRASCRERV
jgi:urocanate hydratase